MLDSGIVKGRQIIMAPPCLHILRSWLFHWSCSSRSLPPLSILPFVRVLSLMRMTSLLLSLFANGFGPLRAHFSLLGYKKMEGSKALFRFAQVVLHQICPGCSVADLFWAFPLFCAILGYIRPTITLLERCPSRGYLSVSFPIQGRLGHSRAPFYYLIHM